jgi:hypothetical protein
VSDAVGTFSGVYLHEGASTAKPQPKKKRRFHHRGTEFAEFGVFLKKKLFTQRPEPYIRSVADYHNGDHLYVTPILRACWDEDHRSLIPLTRIKGRPSRPVRERI